MQSRVIDQKAALAGEHELHALAALRQLDPQRRRERAVEAHADADSRSAMPFELELVAARRDLAGVVEEAPCRAPRRLGIQRHSPDISRLWRSRKRQLRVAAQRAAAAERRQQEVRHLSSSSSVVCSEAVQRQHPVLAQDGDVLDDLGVEPVEAVGVVADRRSCGSVTS